VPVVYGPGLPVHHKIGGAVMSHLDHYSKDKLEISHKIFGSVDSCLLDYGEALSS
jgi:hypothetical protein